MAGSLWVRLLVKERVGESETYADESDFLDVCWGLGRHVCKMRLEDDDNRQ
jgi:hypothetical protein